MSLYGPVNETEPVPDGYCYRVQWVTGQVFVKSAQRANEIRNYLRDPVANGTGYTFMAIMGLMPISMVEEWGGTVEP